MIVIRKNYVRILFLTVLVIAIFFRFWKIGTIPYGFNNDAIWEASAAIEILKGNISLYLPYATEGWRGEGIIRLVVAIIMIFIGNNPVSVTISTAIFGVALVIGIFFLLRQLFNWKIAILTSFFIASSGWHITFSKTGWRAVTVPFFTTFLFYSFFKGLETKKIIHFVLAGTFLSIVSLYTYDGARIVPLFFIFWLIVEIFSRRSFLKTYRKHLVFLFISCFVISLPMLFYASTNWQNFISRSDFLFVGHQIENAGSISPLIKNITTSFLLFNIKANGNDFFIFEPLLDKPVSWFLPLGFLITCYCVFIKKNKNYFFIFCWFLASLIPGILSVPNGNRAIGAIPSVYFFVAVGILYPLQFISDRLPKYKLKYFTAGLILLFCAYTFFVTYRDYLGPEKRELKGFYPETLITANYIKTIWDEYDIYLTDNYPRELLTYYLYRKGYDTFTKNYTWLESNTAFLNLETNQILTMGNNNQNILGKSTSINKKGLAFFMFAIPENELVAEQLMKKYPKSNKFYLWYDNDNIHRPAALVVRANYY